MTLFNTIIAAAKAVKALYERSVFSYRGVSLRNRLNQEWVNSTTHLRALKLGSFSINFFSSPLGRTWGTKPLAFATCSFPTYAASRHRLLGVVPFGGLTIIPFSKTSRETLSCRLAPVTTNDKGTPCSSTRRFRFVPFFSPISWVWANRLLRKWRFNVRPVSRFPEPGDALHCIVHSQSTFPDILKETSCAPLLKLSVNRRRPKALKFLTWQSIPNDARTQHVHDRRKVQFVRVFWFSSASRLTIIGFVSSSMALGEQRLNQVPKFIRHFPGLNACPLLPPSTGFLVDGVSNI